MGRLAVVGKRQTLGPPDPARRVADVEPVAAYDHGSFVAVYRHGADETVPPHRIDYVAELGVLDQLGCDRVLALSSTGSLRPSLPVGSFVAPDDFIALDQPPVTISASGRDHVVPGFDAAWRDRVVSCWSRVADEPLVDHGVYWQTNGPRFETPAEVRFLAAWADLVGMTVGSECVAANQRGVDYAAICVVDNLANGVDAVRLTVEEFARGAAAHRDRLHGALGRLIPELAR